MNETLRFDLVCELGAPALRFPTAVGRPFGAAAGLLPGAELYVTAGSAGDLVAGDPLTASAWIRIPGPRMPRVCMSTPSRNVRFSAR